MLKQIIFVSVTILACFGHAFPKFTRHGNFNSYYLYTRDNPREPIQVLSTAESIVSVPITFENDTAIIVHGHQASAFDSLNPVVKDAYLTSLDINVLIVDWSVFATQRYTNAVSAVPGVGNALADFIQLLVQNNKVSLDRMHLVGFDLGAHVVGFTGRALNGGVARITGLDPSASQWGSSSHRLRLSDARYVEVIHTDGDGLGSNGLGTAIGHVDFFANGGNYQPGCLTHACNHNRAWELFAASLTHENLVGNQCTSDAQLYTNRCRGYALAVGNNDYNKYGSGVFRFNTGRRYPF